MKIQTLIFVWSLSLLCFLIAVCMAIAFDKKDKEAQNVFLAMTGKPIYKPKLKHENYATTRRVGGAEGSTSRGLVRDDGESEMGGGLSSLLWPDQNQKKVKKESILMFVGPLAPKNNGFTSKPQPVLYLYISSDRSRDIEITINKENQDNPVLQTIIKCNEGENIIPIDLSLYKVKLEPDIEYEWFAALILAPDERSSDVIGSATIKYLKPSSELSKILYVNLKDKFYYIYADNGYFYDAVESISSLINEYPEKKKFREHRAALMEQVDLPFIAKYDSQSPR